jgi:hypothetical protein
MAKRTKTDGSTGRTDGVGHEHPSGRTSEGGNEYPAGRTGAIEGFAEDLGRLLGTAQAKAQGWLGQRQHVAKQLEEIRDTAASLLTQLGEATFRRRGRRPGPQGPRKKAQGPRATASGANPPRKLSAKARAAISRAQKKRWAKLKAQG